MPYFDLICERCDQPFRTKRLESQHRPRFCSRTCYLAAHTNRPEDLWSYLDKSGGPDACWPFQGPRDKDGYGKFCANWVKVRAHRLAYELVNGPIPKGQLIRHVVCDNPPCCNPAHLTTGQEADNSSDMVGKGRAAVGDKNASRAHPERLRRGESHPNAKLTDDLVRQIRAAAANGETGASIGRRIGVSKKTVCQVIRGDVWSHVT